MLVAGGNVDLAISTALLLELRVHDSATAFNCREEVDRARTSRPDVFLLDMSLPDGNGFEVARKVRLEPDLQSIRIITISACDLIVDPCEGRDSLIDEYLLKPVALDQ